MTEDGAHVGSDGRVSTLDLWQEEEGDHHLGIIRNPQTGDENDEIEQMTEED